MSNNTLSPGSSGTPNSLPRGLIGRRGAIIGQGTRLPSLRTPRDLTLGGVAKRKYAPTIPVARKEKPKEETTEINSRPGRFQGYRGRGQSRGRGRGRGSSDRDGDTIQMPGIFSNESANNSMRRRIADRTPTTCNYSKRPKGGELKREVKLDTENDEEILKQIYRDDFIDFEDDDEELNALPGVLPLRPAKLITKAENQKKPIKREVKDSSEFDKKEVKDSIELELQKLHGLEIKQEKPDIISDVTIKREPVSDNEDDAKGNPTSEATGTSVHSDTDFMSCAELFCSLKELGQEELLLFHLPDSLPAIPKLKEDEKPGTHAQPKLEEGKSNPGVSLADLSEGCMGKLQVLKSGRTRLILGNIALDVELGTQVGFLQDVVSMHVAKEQGEVATLGHVRHRLVCTPELDKLF